MVIILQAFQAFIDWTSNSWAAAETERSFLRAMSTSCSYSSSVRNVTVLLDLAFSAGFGGLPLVGAPCPSLESTIELPSNSRLLCPAKGTKTLPVKSGGSLSNTHPPGYPHGSPTIHIVSLIQRVSTRLLPA